MTNLKNINDNELQKIIDSTKNQENVVENKGFLKKIFSKNKKMDKDKEITNTIKEEVKDTTNNVVNTTNNEVSKEEIEKINTENETINNEISKEENNFIDKKITDVIPQEEIDKINDKYEKKRLEKETKLFNETKNDVCNKSEYKIATFKIKVKNDNVGNVLTKIGQYSSELNELPEVEHCDLNINDY